MRLVSLDNLPERTSLAKDIFTSANADVPLLRRGVTLDERYRKALRDQGITTLWVEDDLSEGIDPVSAVSDETRKRATEAVGKALKEAQVALTSGKGLSDASVTELQNVAQLIAMEIMHLPDVALQLADMMSADQYLTQHVIDVTALGTVLARKTFNIKGWIDYQGKRRFGDLDARLSKIALGLLLHDIGKLSIPPEILNKPGKLNDAEWELIRRHPTDGFDMLGHDVSFLVKAVVRQHHERWDGTGYPDKVPGDRIHQFARIASVADVYDAVTSERAYKHAAPPCVGYDIIESGSGTAFDPEIVEVFRTVVTPYPPGYEVVLLDGRAGVVVEADPDDPLHPTVRVRNANGTVDEIARADLRLPPEDELLAA